MKGAGSLLTAPSADFTVGCFVIGFFYGLKRFLRAVGNEEFSFIVLKSRWGEMK